MPATPHTPPAQARTAAEPAPSAYTARRAHQSAHWRLRGLDYHACTWGEPTMASATRPPLVLVHGWADVGASFQFLVDALQEPRWIIAPDWRGFGASANSGADGYWFQDYLGDLDALIDHLSPQAPVDLLGHSMGGNAAMLYTGARPQRVRRLVNLEGFGVPHVAATEVPARLAQWLDELKTPQHFSSFESVHAVAQRLMKNNPRLGADKAAWLAAHWAAPAADGRWHVRCDPAHKRINPVPTRAEDVQAFYAAITCPVLFVRADGSEPEKWWQGRYSLKEFDARLAHVRQLQRTTIGPAGHMLHHDQPEALARCLEQFLA